MSVGLTSAEDSVEVVAPPQFKAAIEQMKNDYKPNKTAVSPVVMKIVLEKEAPIYASPSRLPPAHEKVVEEKVAEWLEKGIISPSTSQYCSRVVVVNKKISLKEFA